MVFSHLLLLAAKKFGVNEFVNSKDHNKSIQEVSQFYWFDRDWPEDLKSKDASQSIYMFIFKEDMLISQDEIFGPVMVLSKFKSIEERIEKANSSKYGLASGIVTKNMDIANTVSRSIRAGIVWINCFFAFDIDCPFGGYKMSGFGRDYGLEALD
ncbi:hypothetical protein Ahy_A01g001883 isoform D [Arachis hypogaea]|uniref:Aldehyde dehydrogenase domain-containing protein n=2 Tax=Arachis TaxID=3817 RepID=A0A445EPU0_ARAHY|nr:hypothetical protein Ahy_A01g001883 isoform D [Arachis hypogaea]